MDFYVTLPSNVKFSNNKIGNFTTKLAQKIKLDGKYEVGLKSISFTKSWYNFQKEITINVANPYQRHKRYPNHAKLPAGNYTTDQLVDRINEKLKTFPGPPTLVYKKSINRFGFVTGLIFPHEKQYPLIWSTPPLGIESLIFRDIPMIKTEVDEEDGLSYLYAEHDGLQPLLEAFVFMDPVYGANFFSGDISSLIVTSNIVEHTPFGNKAKQLLRIVEVPKNLYGDQIVIRYDDPHYVPLQSREFETIDIDIKDDYENDVHFKFGRVIVTLHFRCYE